MSYQNDNEYVCLGPTEEEAEIERLRDLYYQWNNEFEIAKRKRNLWTVVLFAVAYFALFASINKPTNFGLVIFYLLVSLVVSIVHFFINLSVFGHLSSKASDEARKLHKIKWEIDNIDDYKIADEFITKHADFMSHKEKRALRKLVLYGFYLPQE